MTNDISREPEILELMFRYPEKIDEILSQVSSDYFIDDGSIRLAVEIIEADRKVGATITKKGVYRRLEAELGKEVTDVLNQQVLDAGASIENLDLYIGSLYDSWSTF